MSSVECLRDFVSERLAAAAEEIFEVFSKMIVEYEEEIARQRRLLDVVWKPEINLHRIELPQQLVCKEEEEEEVLSDQERNSSLDQKGPEPSQIKEEQEELCTSQEGEQLVLNQEIDTFMWIPCYEGSDHSESESNSDHHQLLADSSHHVAESQDQKVGVHGDFQSTTDAETKLQVEHHESTSDSQVSHEYGTCGKIFPYKSKLQKHLSVHTGEKTLLLSGAKKETIINISVKSTALPEPKADHHLLTHNSHEGESQVHKVGEHRDSASTSNVDRKLEKRLRINVCTIQPSTSADTKLEYFICDQCGKECKSKHKLARHMISHTDERPCFCNTCGRSFKDKWSLGRHKRIHTSAKPFPCKLCGENFRLKSTLESHLAMHAGKRPFTCHICGKSYSRVTNLRTHLSIHTLEKLTCKTLESSVVT